MTIRVGDVVTVRLVKWVVACFEPDGVRLLRNEGNRLQSLLCSPQHLVAVDHPIFAPGEKVILSDGSVGTVLIDDGIGTVRCQGAERLPIRGGGYVTGFAGGEHDADRAELIVTNGRL